MKRRLHRFKIWLRTQLIRSGAWRPRVYPGDDLHIRGLPVRGTVGAFVRQKGVLFALTCEHVLAEAGTSPRRGAKVHSRSLAPGAEKVKSISLGEVHEWLKIDYSGKTESMDAALIRVGTRRVHCVRPEIGETSRHAVSELEMVERLEAMEAGGSNGRMLVEKFGAKSGLTRGRVQGYFNLKPQEFPFRINGVYEIEGLDSHPIFCDDGDSGAVVWDSSVTPKRPVGLLVANTFYHKGYAIPIQSVLDRLKVELEGTD